jgi:hypothetical protein
VKAPPVQLPDAETLSRLEQIAHRSLSKEEFDAYVDAPMSEHERAEIHALIDWFTRRYPTPLERLRAARRFYLRARARMPKP